MKSNIIIFKKVRLKGWIYSIDSTFTNFVKFRWLTWPPFPKGLALEC